MASKMRLFEHRDFGQAVIAAQWHFDRPGLTEQFIEKDYYVTEGCMKNRSALGGTRYGHCQVSKCCYYCKSCHFATDMK